MQRFFQLTLLIFCTKYRWFSARQHMTTTCSVKPLSHGSKLTTYCYNIDVCFQVVTQSRFEKSRVAVSVTSGKSNMLTYLSNKLYANTLMLQSLSSLLHI